MRESESTNGIRAMGIEGSPIPFGETDFTAFRIAAARAFWPHKTAEHLAAEAGCSVRMAKFYLAGTHPWSSAAVRAIASKII